MIPLCISTENGRGFIDVLTYLRVKNTPQSRLNVTEHEKNNNNKHAKCSF